ncbi:hypothetical protein GCM10010392_20570 [Streptomyces clavifer]|nr:hypothetical protein GCM10010392_20570 [Streptomyces clavifer]
MRLYVVGGFFGILEILPDRLPGLSGRLHARTRRGFTRVPGGEPTANGPGTRNGARP